MSRRLKDFQEPSRSPFCQRGAAHVDPAGADKRRQPFGRDLDRARLRSRGRKDGREAAQ